MNTSYKKLAYEVTVFALLRRTLEEKYLQGGGSLKEDLICELVPYADRQVPNETVADVIQRLLEEERRLSEEMAQYEFRKRDVRPIAKAPEEVPEQPVPAAKPAGAKPGGKNRRS